MTVQPETATVAHQQTETVHVTHLADHEKTSFKVVPTITLQALWDESYKELKVKKEPRDVFQAPHKPHPIDLMPHLALTLAQAEQKSLCKDQFEIAAGTGGA